MAYKQPTDIGNYPYANSGAYAGKIKAPTVITRPPQSAIELGTELVGRIPKQNINFNTYNHPAIIGARQQQLAAYPGGNNVNPNAMSMFLQGQSQEAVGNLGTVLPNFDSSFVRNAPIIGPDNIPYLGSRMDNAPLEGYPYRGEFYNENTFFTQGGQPTGVPSAPQVPSRVPAAVVAPSQYSQPAARTSAVSSVGQPASNVQVQPTQSGQISPIGLQGATRAMDAPATYVPEGQQVNPSWLQSTTDKLGEFLGVQNGTQYLKNFDGSLMVDASGNNIVDTSGRTWGDIGSGVKGAADIGMGLYGMFTSMDQNQHALDTQRGQLNLMREKFAEDKRKNQAIVAQNRGA